MPLRLDEPIDDYLPQNGNRGYRVSRYELELVYKMSSNRLAGHAEITAVTIGARDRFALDLSQALSVSKVFVNGAKPAKYVHQRGKLVITPRQKIPAGAALVLSVHYAGPPKPVRGPWGEVGWEELTDGALVASQPNGAASWFPCDDHPSSKASYRISITTDSPYYAVANGTLMRKQTKASQTTWVYEQPEPMSSYLATIQIGQYRKQRLDAPRGAVPMQAVIPPRLRAAFEHDFARQPRMMEVFSELFGPYPFEAYTVVVTDDDLEIPIEAQGISVFGANHCDGRRGHERLVAHELAHQWFGNSLTIRQWRDIWLHEGFACYAEWIWSEAADGPSADQLARTAHRNLSRLPQDLLLADPGPEHMFDDRVYKRGALTLHALRLTIGDAAFFDLLRTWTARYRHASITTGEFTDLAGHYNPLPLQSLWDSWLYARSLPALPTLPAYGPQTSTG
ncbi:M1 family metallopeptidase [Nocardia seriolae]|uniref:Aminopeptidase N n=1 Tax=Nocardia seriolae TaxID=37332 RepID=A0A0B8N5L6_9NOCA|nr:M1 family metallopeptidase [Nocardia seriolae]APA98996.1 Aminopeptidase N [Nocardia seriolae]MTJ64046.1 M1 family peptidase [Nocardia seriolae]MTJ71286.1 M1 family peptidase [Nocardia seriolae]MTJ88607.1 M1 family peptidase [Nocardia seriolae]MTK41932.1 M1 family peptidase [Nocardia seriolae]